MTVNQPSHVALGPYMSVVDMTPENRRGSRTAYFEVLDRHDGVLGAIRWYGAWRQYCFFPDSDTAPVFNPDCLTRIAAFAALCTRKQREHVTDGSTGMEEKR